MAEKWGNWYPTPELRFKTVELTVEMFGEKCPVPDRVLQQKWCRIRDQVQFKGTTYDEEWRDVPTE